MKTRTINVGSEILRQHTDLINDCERLLPKGAEFKMFSGIFFWEDNSIEVNCYYQLRGKSEMMRIIWKGGEE